MAERISRWDWKGIFAYSTVKEVQVRDLRLGVLRWLLVLAVWIYVLCDIFIHQRYNLKETPVPGVVRAALQDPVNTQNASPPSYCTTQTPCTFWTANQAAYPTVSGYEVFLTTAVHFDSYGIPPGCNTSFVPDAEQTVASLQPGQSANAPDRISTQNSQMTDLMNRSQCLYTNGPRGKSRSYLVANTEKFQIGVEHVAHYRTTSDVLSSNQLDGALIYGNATGSDPSALVRFDNSQPHNTNATSQQPPIDTFLLSDLLGAAGIDLNVTNRYAGAVINVLIDYQNQHGTFSSSNGVVRYVYRPKVISMADDHRVELRHNPDGTVTEVGRNGIRIVFQQTGQLGHFDFMTLLVYMCTAISLLAIATLLLETLMLYVLPQRYLYHAHKYDKLNGLQATKPAGTTMLDDDASFYTANQSGLLTTEIIQHGIPSPVHPRRVSFLRVTNPNEHSNGSAMSNRTLDRLAGRRTSSLPPPPRRPVEITTTDADADDDAPPAYRSPTITNRSRGAGLQTESATTNPIHNQNGVASASNNPFNQQGATQPRSFRTCQPVYEDTAEQEANGTAPPKSLDRRFESSGRPRNGHDKPSDAILRSPIHEADTGCNFSLSPTLPPDSRPSVAPSSMISRSHMRTDLSPKQAQDNYPPDSNQSRRAYQYAPPSSRNSQMQDKPATPFTPMGTSPADRSGILGANTSFTLEPPGPSALMSPVLPDNTAAAAVTNILAGVIADNPHLAAPDMVGQTANAEDAPACLLVPVADAGDNATAGGGYPAGMEVSYGSEPVSEYESNDNSMGSAADILPADLHRGSYSENESILAHAVYASHVLDANNNS